MPALVYGLGEGAARPPEKIREGCLRLLRSAICVNTTRRCLRPKVAARQRSAWVVDGRGIGRDGPRRHRAGGRERRRIGARASLGNDLRPGRRLRAGSVHRAVRVRSRQGAGPPMRLPATRSRRGTASISTKPCRPGQTAKDMNSKYKETSEAGLAFPCALLIERDSSLELRIEEFCEESRLLPAIARQAIGTAVAWRVSQPLSFDHVGTTFRRTCHVLRHRAITKVSVALALTSATIFRSQRRPPDSFLYLHQIALPPFLQPRARHPRGPLQPLRRHSRHLLPRSQVPIATETASSFGRLHRTPRYLFIEVQHQYPNPIPQHPKQRVDLHRPSGRVPAKCIRATTSRSIARCSSSAATFSTRGRDTASPSGRPPGAASIIVASNIGWTFNKAFAITGGYTGVPGSRSLVNTFPFFTATDRSMADNFFRPGFTQGVWANGEPVKSLNYLAFVGNGLNTLSISANKIDTHLLFAGSVWWEPLGAFGEPGKSRNMYDDYVASDKVRIRLGTSFTRSREDRFSNLDQSSPENTSLRIPTACCFSRPERSRRVRPLTRPPTGCGQPMAASNGTGLPSTRNYSCDG